MPPEFSTRTPRVSDMPALAAIADATLFPGEMLASMITPALEGEADDIWRVVLQGERPVGFGFAQAEPMTDGTWNLRAICTAPELHGQGAGSALLASIEDALRDARARLIMIDTTQTEDQARARRFYAARGYTHVATIPDFFAVGEDKVSFIKAVR